MENPDLKRRIIELSYKYKRSHIGSCISAVDIIDSIYYSKHDWEPFILSSGHAGLALYCVLEKHLGLDAEKLFLKHGTHPNRDIENNIYCSTGSLGHGLGIALGMALAERTMNVYCLVSDGEMAEGSVYEALNFAKERGVKNLKIHVNCNGYGAYKRVYDYRIADILALYYPVDITIHKTEFEFPFLKGQDAHYHTMNEEDYTAALKMLVEE